MVPDELDQLSYLRIKLSSAEDPDALEIGHYNHYTLPNPAAELTINPKSQTVAINQYMLVSGDNQDGPVHHAGCARVFVIQRVFHSLPDPG